jgi:hypothetical protein
MANEDLLTPDEVKDAREIFEGKIEGRSGCVHCAGIHNSVNGLKADRQPCPRVKRAVWHSDGTLLEVEYWPRGEWDRDEVNPGSWRHIIYPSDVYSVDEEGD